MQDIEIDVEWFEVSNPLEPFVQHINTQPNTFIETRLDRWFIPVWVVESRAERFVSSGRVARLRENRRLAEMSDRADELRRLAEMSGRANELRRLEEMSGTETEIRDWINALQYARHPRTPTSSVSNITPIVPIDYSLLQDGDNLLTPEFLSWAENFLETNRRNYTNTTHDLMELYTTTLINNPIITSESIQQHIAASTAESIAEPRLDEVPF